MYIARFSYAVLPVNRQRAIDFIRREVEAAQRRQLDARLLVPLTRSHGGAALQFEVELADLDQFEQFRERGIESDAETGSWMHAFSEILTAPPEVELLRVDEAGSQPGANFSLKA
ncbi:MAG TPA: hypothetical protein VGO08_18580 [Burkholderiales bacterium]|jgi:hypothetical protein|nr:hypothetical protein [Burkholderiales bacterium]